MPFITIPTKDGPVTAHILRRNRRFGSLCEFCRNQYVSKLCDFATGKNKTCDAGMCDKCATNVGRNRDYCPAHKHQALPPQRSLFGCPNEAA
jgi:hypothetical protein